MVLMNGLDYIDLDSVGSTLTKDLKVFPIDITEGPETASEADEMMGVYLYFFQYRLAISISCLVNNLSSFS